jgi:hypothetical protein
MEARTEPVMNASIAETSESIDGKTCRSICDAVGERLQRDLRPDSAGLSPHLERLLNELERRDLSGATPAASARRSWAR